MFQKSLWKCLGGNNLVLRCPPQRKLEHSPKNSYFSCNSDKSYHFNLNFENINWKRLALIKTQIKRLHYFSVLHHFFHCLKALQDLTHDELILLSLTDIRIFPILNLLNKFNTISRRTKLIRKRLTSSIEFSLFIWSEERLKHRK